MARIARRILIVAQWVFTATGIVTVGTVLYMMTTPTEERRAIETNYKEVARSGFSWKVLAIQYKTSFMQTHECNIRLVIGDSKLDAYMIDEFGETIFNASCDAFRFENDLDHVKWTAYDELSVELRTLKGSMYFGSKVSHPQVQVVYSLRP